MNMNIRKRSMIWWYSLSKEEKDYKYPEDSHDPYMPYEIEFFYKNHIQEQRNNKINEILNEN